VSYIYPYQPARNPYPTYTLPVLCGYVRVCTGVLMTQPSEAAECKTFRLSNRLSIEITAGPAGFVCEWDPARPERLTAGELRRYRAARHEMLSRLAERLGVRITCVEI
jgi:hypothetical protein